MNNFVPDDGTCPWHGGNGGNFHIVFDEKEKDKGYAKCFSSACVHEEGSADVIEFVRRTLNLESPKEAALQINADFKLGLVFETTTVQKIYWEALDYYRNLLLTTKVYESLNGKTPMAYQTENRGHREESLLHFQVGWSDGELHKHLKAKGFEYEDMVASGLVILKKGGRAYQDKLPEESFIYPAFVNGRPSRFTFKTQRTGSDGQKLTWQIKKECWLNDVVMMGQDSIKDAEDVAIVEGENDMISCMRWAGKAVFSA